MKNFVIILFLFLLSCKTVSDKIDETTKAEEARLSKYLNVTESELKIGMGIPDRIDFKDDNRSRFYVYTQEKFKIKCERVFELNANNVVVGFTSKNCF